VRETFEEAGLRVGRPVGRAPRTRSASWHGFLAAGVVPCLDGLEFVARAITPPDSPRRYDARFFLADAAEIAGDPDALRAGDGELGELGWIPVDDARSLELPAVTRLVLDEVAKRLAARPAERAALPAPFWRFRGERPVLELL
jgi:8-oxo-dGTP pyrophosphatase MutT (NUDIX family)